MNESIRGRHWGSDTALRQAHGVTTQKLSDGAAIGFRLAVDSEEQACRGGAWKSRAPEAAQGWSVEEWLTSGHTFTSFRLAREQE